MYLLKSMWLEDCVITVSAVNEQDAIKQANIFADGQFGKASNRNGTESDDWRWEVTLLTDAPLLTWV